MARYWFALATGGLVLLCTTPAAADKLHLRGGVAAAHAVGGHQQDELSIGGDAFLGLEFRVLPEIALGAKAIGVSLTPGAESEDVSIERTRGASLYGGAFTFAIYPGVGLDDGSASGSLSRLWIAGSGGMARTGELWRPIVGASVGWDAYVPAPTFGLGPVVSFLHVFQPNDRVRPADADVISVGVSARFGVEPRLPERDSDGDHIPDRHDKCPKQAEDLDGFQDQDGCPDDDNDGDGILDEEDDCPDLAEDENGIVDEDGCPEGKLDSAYDQDGDGVEDTQDKCPTEPEDRDGFQDEDGCPDPDNDGDQLPDAKDLCPNEPETENGYADGDGCPDEDQVRVVGGEIVLDEVVRFATNSAEISKESDALLGRLAKLIREHPEYIHISIEGHADMRGTEQQNVALSADRARAVLDRLVKEGVAPGRLSSKGFGSSRPKVPGKDDAALAKNRRVEFVVTRAGDRQKEAP